MNSTLTDYGIRQEKSRWRLHICPLSRHIYFFKTQAAIDAIDNGNYSEKEVMQGEYLTARGYAVPWQDIEGIKEITPPTGVWNTIGFNQYDREDIKGEKAVRVAVYCFNTGLFSFGIVNALPHEVTEISVQIDGTDIIVLPWGYIQVKCDYRGGRGGTGNLFIQIAESNPYNYH